MTDTLIPSTETIETPALVEAVALATPADTEVVAEAPEAKTPAAPKRAAKPALVIVMDKENREALQTAGKRVATTGAAPQRKTRTATAAKSR